MKTFFNDDKYQYYLSPIVELNADAGVDVLALSQNPQPSVPRRRDWSTFKTSKIRP